MALESLRGTYRGTTPREVPDVLAEPVKLDLSEMDLSQEASSGEAFGEISFPGRKLGGPSMGKPIGRRAVVCPI